MTVYSTDATIEKSVDMEKLLSKLINREKTSTNILIKKSGIDRSTFYKIKKGEREPTETQFSAIVRQLSVTEQEKRELIEEYEYHRHWKKNNEQSFKIARQFLFSLNDRSYDTVVPGCRKQKENRIGQKPLPKEILDFFKTETEKESGGEIRMFISPQILDLYNWGEEELVSVFNDSKGEWEVQVLVMKSMEDQYDPVRKMDHIKRLVQFVERTKADVNIYRDVHTTDLLLSDPYPYWLIGGSQLLLIANNLQEYYYVREKTVVQNYTKSFDYRCDRAYNILKRYGHLKDVIREMTERCDQVVARGKHMYVMSAVPSSVLCVQEDQIRRYCPERLASLLIEYQSHFLPAVSCEFTTCTGYEKMKNSRTIPEWDFFLQYRESELLIIEENIRRRMEEHRLYFLDEEFGYAPDDYSIALFEDWEINVQSLSNPSVFLQIREKELVHALQKWFSYQDEIARIEKNLDLVKDPFGVAEVETAKS